jgi:Lipopolysaccharide-assembly
MRPLIFRGVRFKSSGSPDHRKKELFVKSTRWNSHFWLACLFILVVGPGCGGYGFRGMVNNLPPDIKAVSIPAFVNESIEPGMEVIFANALIYEFSRSHILQVVSDSQAQAQIIGKIKSIAVDLSVYANVAQALTRRVTVTLEVTCRRVDNQKILWQNQSLARYEDFQASSDPLLTQLNKEEAIKKIAQDLSEKIHNSILENF